MQYFSDSQLDAMFRLLDFDQLEQMGYDLSMSPEGDLGDEDFLQSLLESIEEDFSGFDREQKIAELREVGAFDDDYLVSEVKMSAEEHKHCDGCEEVRIINDFSLSNAIDDKEQTLTQGEVCDYCFEDFYGASAMSAETTDSDFPTVGKIRMSEGSPKVYTFYGIRTELTNDYGNTKGKKYPYTAVGFGDKLEAWNHPNWGAKRLQGYNKEDPEEGTIDCGPDDDPDEFIELFFDLTEENKKDIRAIGDYVTDPRTNESYWTYKDAETKRQRMKREKEEAAMDEASTDVDYMREHYSESDAYIYAYNDGHTDSRGAVGYRPSATDRELTSFKKIFKQAEFAADSPFNTLLMIREDIIIDDEEDFDRLLSIYMSLETDIAQLYQETNNPKHPLLGEMMRYRNRIANRLDELQEEVAIQDTIEMDAEHRGTFSRPQEAIPVTLEKPIRTGYKIGLGWVAAALTIPLAIVGIGAFYNQE